MKKYTFLGKTKVLDDGVEVHRIVAVTDFKDLNGETVNAGDLGGCIESEKNLSQDGIAWVRVTAIVCGNAVIKDNALISNDAVVSGNAKITGNARVKGHAKVRGDAQVRGHAEVTGWAIVQGAAVITNYAHVSDHVVIDDDAIIKDNSKIFGRSKIYGNAVIKGNSAIGSHADIFSEEQVLVVGPIGSRGDFTTFYRNAFCGISVKCGCFRGDIVPFLERVTATHGNNKFASIYRAAAELAKLQIRDLKYMKDDKDDE